jgi:uncharacterized protein YbjT (DUF2867 family)
MFPAEKIDFSGYPPKHVVIAGATGMVGREIIRVLDERPNVTFTALTRRSGALSGLSGRVREVEFDYNDPKAINRIGQDIPCNVLLCALGTTIKKAGSPEAFRLVDFEYPSRLFEHLKQLPNKPMVGVVSSVGAGKPTGLYLKTKYDMEQSLIESGLPHLIVRPSLILGERHERQPVEWVLAAVFLKFYLAVIKVLAPQFRPLWRFAPIEGAKVAEAMVRICVDEPPLENSRILEGLALHHPIMQ